MAIRTGDAASGFTLPVRPGETIDVGSHIGTDKVVLLFFPLSFSPVCTDEFCTIRDDWAAYFELLADGNKRWAERAAMLIVLCARTRLEHNDAATDTFGFDVGAAWQNLALQGTSMGLVVHGMRGFDKNAAREVLEIPELFSIEAMIAVGRPGEISELPESNQAKEMPSGRKSIDEFSAAGKFRFE